MQMLAAPPLGPQCGERPADPSQPRAQAGWGPEVTGILVICPVGMVTPSGLTEVALWNPLAARAQTPCLSHFSTKVFTQGRVPFWQYPWHPLRRQKKSTSFLHAFLWYTSFSKLCPFEA